MAKKTALSKGEKLLLFSVLAFLLLIIAVTFWLQGINATPEISIPAPIMPSPNARDSYQQALRAFIPYYILRKIPESEARRYPPIGIVIHRHDPSQQGMSIIKYPLTYDELYVQMKYPTYIAASESNFATASLAEMQALARANAPSFAALRTGFRYDYRGTPRRSFSDHHQPYEFPQFFTLAKYLLVDGRIKRLSGDWRGAAKDAIDCLRVGADIPHGSALIGFRGGMEIQGMGWGDIEETIGHLDAAQARDAARQMEEVAGRQTSFADALQEEQWDTQASLLELFQGANWRQELMHAAGQRGKPSFAMNFISKRQVLHDYTHYLDALIATAKLPYATAVTIAAPPLPDDPFARMLAPAPALGKVRQQDAECLAENSLLMLEFALHAYHQERGSYPITLEKLTPVYLQSTPSDPCGAGESLHYRRTGQGYTLYSCGPNGKDDHGTGDDIVVNKPSSLGQALIHSIIGF